MVLMFFLKLVMTVKKIMVYVYILEIKVIT